MMLTAVNLVIDTEHQRGSWDKTFPQAVTRVMSISTLVIPALSVNHRWEIYCTVSQTLVFLDCCHVLSSFALMSKILTYK